LLRIYTGVEISVIPLKNKLKVKGISVMIRNNLNNSFLQTASGDVDLYIQQYDLKKQSPFYLNSLKAVMTFSLIK
jgi:hypothetical protein